MASKPILSVLDPAPIFDGRSAPQALDDTRILAEACDKLGYRSYWVQEHHNTSSFASVAPEILIADLAARTKQIMIGAGGVMLPNYSPLKVAEQFTTLSALHPGRIEIGVGRATGADPMTSAALLGPGADAFPTMMRLLMDWLLDASGHTPLPDGHRASGVHAKPMSPHPGLWMLVSSPESAAFAGAMGVSVAYADFLAPGGAPAAFEVYRKAFKPSPFAGEPRAALAVVALAAGTDKDAERLSRPTVAWNVVRASGRFIPFPSPEVADSLLSLVPPEAVRAAKSRAITGSQDEVADRICEAAAECVASEVFVLTIASPITARIRSYQLLADAMERQQTAEVMPIRPPAT